MKTSSYPCPNCNKLIIVEYYAAGDTVRTDKGPQIVPSDEEGWRVYDCPSCGTLAEYEHVVSFVQKP